LPDPCLPRIGDFLDSHGPSRGDGRLAWGCALEWLHTAARPRRGDIA